MNITICSVAVVFLLSSIFMMFLKDEKLFTNFMNTLNDKQKNIYFKIIKERTMLYVGGMMLGLLLGFIYLSMNKKTGLYLCFHYYNIYYTDSIL